MGSARKDDLIVGPFVVQTDESGHCLEVSLFLWNLLKTMHNERKQDYKKNKTASYLCRESLQHHFICYLSDKQVQKGRVRPGIRAIFMR